MTDVTADSTSPDELGTGRSHPVRDPGTDSGESRIEDLSPVSTDGRDVRSTTVCAVRAFGVGGGLDCAISVRAAVAGARTWKGLADSIDERLASGPDWLALAAALHRAAGAGYDVTGNLARLADQDALPARHPARELQFRLMAECDAAMPPRPFVGDAKARPGNCGLAGNALIPFR